MNAGRCSKYSAIGIRYCNNKVIFLFSVIGFILWDGRISISDVKEDLESDSCSSGIVFVPQPSVY